MNFRLLLTVTVLHNLIIIITFKQKSVARIKITIAKTCGAGGGEQAAKEQSTEYTKFCFVI